MWFSDASANNMIQQMNGVTTPSESNFQNCFDQLAQGLVDLRTESRQTYLNKDD